MDADIVPWGLPSESPRAAATPAAAPNVRLELERLCARMQAFPPPLRYEPLARDNVNSGSSYSSSLLLPRVSAMPTVLPAPVLDVRDGDVRQTLADRESELLDLRDKHDDEVMRLKTALRAKELELRRRSDDTLTPTSMRPADRSVMHTENRELRQRVDALKASLAEASAREASARSAASATEDKLRRQLEQLEHTLRDREADLNAVARKSREQQAAYARLEQESSASISRRADEVHQLQRLHDENKELREQLDTAMSTLKRVREREASAAGALTGQDATISQLKRALQASQTETARWQDKHRECNREVKRLSEQLSEAENMREEVERMRAAFKSSAQVARELATRTDEVHQWKQRCRLLENQLTELKTASAEQAASLQMLADSRLRVIEGLQQDLRAMDAASHRGGDDDNAREGVSKETLRLRLELEGAARKLSQREQQLRDMESQLRDHVRMNTRLQLALEEEHQRSGSGGVDADGSRDLGDIDVDGSGDLSGGSDHDPALTLSMDVSPQSHSQQARRTQGGARSRSRGDVAGGGGASPDAGSGGAGRDRVVALLQQRDSDAEMVLEMVEGLLVAVSALCDVVAARLSGDAVPLSSIVGHTAHASSGSLGDVSLPRVRWGAVAASCSDAACSVAFGYSDDQRVIDRTAAAAIVSRSVSRVVKLRTDVTEAIATSIGNECAMQ